MTDKGTEGGSKPKYETIFRKTDRIHTNGSPILEKVKVKVEIKVTDFDHPPEEPPDIDTLHPIDEQGNEIKEFQLPLKDLDNK